MVKAVAEEVPCAFVEGGGWEGGVGVGVKWEWERWEGKEGDEDREGIGKG